MRKDFGSVCLLVAGCVVALLATVAVAAPASKADKSGKPAQKTPYEPTSHYTIMNMEGWKVYVNKALLPGGAHAKMGAKAIERLRGDMVLVKHWVADEALAKLLKVGVWLELDSTNGPHGRTPTFHYHPFLGWLKKMDFHPGKHKCVEYSRAASLVTNRRGRGTAKILLHELAHAYHDQVLSFNDRDILAAHKRAREGGKYPKNDWVVRANHKEFFAGVSTRYFGTKGEREALVERDPILLKKLQKVWGKPRASKADKSGKAAEPDKPAKPTKPAPKTPYEPTSHYTIMNMEGWKVYVNKALLSGGAHAKMGAKAIERLRGDMVLVKRWVADEALAKLLKVGIWLELDTTNGPHGRTPVFHYHSYLGWLKKMDFHPGKHKCVEYSRAASLVMIRRGKRTAIILLHELAHAYHDQVLSFNDPDILAAHKRAREGGKYPRNDRVVRADHKEFFAGVSTRYFGTKGEREALVERDPILLKKLQKVWGKPRAYMDSPPPKGKTSPGEPRSGGAK
jgi:dipeptidyl-peptidase-4